MKKITLMVAAFGCVVLLNTGCENKHDSKAVAEDSNEKKFDAAAEKDAKFAVDVTAVNLFEMKAAELAKSKAMTADAKNLADMMWKTHSKAHADLSAMAARKQITIPTSVSSTQQEEVNDLDHQTGLDFDKKYASMMVDKHEDAVKLFEDASTNCKDEEIRVWAANALPDLRSHLEMSKNCKENINK